MPPRRLFHTSLSSRTFLRNSRSRSSLSDVSTRTIPRGPWLHLLRTMFSAPRLPRPLPSLLLDAAVQTPLYSVASHNASTQLPLTEFFIGCIFSNDPFDRRSLAIRHSAMLAEPHLHNPLTLLRFAVPAAPATPATVTSTLRLHVCHHSRLQVSRSMPVSAPHMVYLVKGHPLRPRLCTSISVTPPQPHVSTTQVGTHPVRSATTYKRSASTALAGTHNPVGADPQAGTGPFPKPRAQVLLMVKFGQSKPDGLGHIDTADSDLMHHQYRLSVLLWNPGPARRNPTNIIAAACGRFHAVILQEASDHVPHISDQFMAYTGNTDLVYPTRQGHL